ncbi:MAG: helix-turn-helix transcriptional regulator [Candidatus Goldbacteria bacterium]|nr:helix-turn-helix transcriptional regulator [Candidatus Goldiibacteriota bacterium]
MKTKKAGVYTDDKIYEKRKKEHRKSSEYRETYEEERLSYMVAEEIKELRGKKHYTQKQLAEKAGVKQQEISRVEKGGQNITIGLLNKIANGMGKKIKISII